MEVDHLFVFTDRVQEAAARLSSFGLSEGTPNTHPGQGTACRRFYFQNAYLELVWVSSEVEIQSPAIQRTRFWQRSRSMQTGYSPFGICVRRTKPTERTLFEESWHYAPSFFPAGHYASIARNEAFPAEPMLFEVPLHQRKPLDYPFERQQPLLHPAGFRQITSLALTMPTAEPLSDSLQQVIQHGSVRVVQGASYHATIEFDYGARRKEESFTPVLPLSFRW
jgi:hypothetical protein